MGRGNHQTLQTGGQAPDAPLRTLDGEALTAASLWAEGPVVIAFYKASCPTCQLALPFLERLRAGGARVYCVAQDDAATARAFNAEFDMRAMPTLLDPAGDGYPASNAFGINFVPSIFLVGPGGAILWDSAGFLRAGLERLGERLGIAVFHDGDIVPAAKGG